MLLYREPGGFYPDAVATTTTNPLFQHESVAERDRRNESRCNRIPGLKKLVSIAISVTISVVRAKETSSQATSRL